MAAYITTGTLGKAMLACHYIENPLNRNDEWANLDNMAGKLEQELDSLRTTTDRWGNRYRCHIDGAILDRVRTIRKELSSIDARMVGITLELNPKYKAYYGL